MFTKQLLGALTAVGFLCASSGLADAQTSTSAKPVVVAPKPQQTTRESKTQLGATTAKPQPKKQGVAAADLSGDGRADMKRNLKTPVLPNR